MFKEFKEFISNGNVFEAAVGLILALAFAPVVQGLVDQVIMPVVARIFGQPDFSDIKIGLGGSQEVVVDEATGATAMVEPTILIGDWITTVVGFIILAFVVFMMVRLYNKATRKVEEEDGPSDNDLLVEIRDSLANRG